MQDSPAQLTVAERLDSVERANRWLCRVVAGLFLVSVALGEEVYRGRSPSGRVVEAEKVVIRDKLGRVRGSFGLDSVALPGLKLFDEQGREQAALETPGDDTATLSLAHQGRTRLTLDASADGSSALRFHDPAGRSASALFMWQNGTTGLSFSSGLQGLMMGVQTNGDSALILTDPDGRERARVGDLAVNLRSLGLDRGGSRPRAEKRSFAPGRQKKIPAVPE